MTSGKVTFYCLIVGFHEMARIIWKQCADLPTVMSSRQSTVIGGKVYFCGGDVDDNDWGEQFEYLVYCYDTSQDKWTTLPPLPNRWFSLCQMNDRLAAIGGRKKGNWERVNEVYLFNGFSQKWEKTLPPMSTAKSTMAALSLRSSIATVGGRTKNGYTNVVEIFRPETSQWYKTSSIPTTCCATSAVCIDNICYVLGGYNDPLRLNQALYASVDDLLSNAVPGDVTINSGSVDIWKKIPNTPTYQPVAAILNNNLITIGGLDRVDGEVAQKAVYMYNPTKNLWTYADDLPGPLVGTSTAMHYGQCPMKMHILLSSVHFVLYRALFAHPTLERNYVPYRALLHILLSSVLLCRIEHFCTSYFRAYFCAV